MIREIKVEKTSYKRRSVNSHNMWILVGREVDLNTLKWGNVYTCEVSQLMDGRYIIEKVLNPSPVQERTEIEEDIDE